MVKLENWKWLSVRKRAELSANLNLKMVFGKIDNV